MKGIMFRPEVWKAKLRVLQDKGEAQTRRLITLPDGWSIERVTHAGQLELSRRDGSEPRFLRPRYLRGETVYVKEAIRPYDVCNPWSDPRRVYVLDGAWAPLGIVLSKSPSPMFMKAENARYFLTIKDVRPERLQEITEADARAEGCVTELLSVGDYRFRAGHTEIWPREAYAALWDSINKKPMTRWADNPFIWAYTFALVPRPER